MENIQQQNIRGYELHELLAQGGMGEVYRATQTVVGREVVIKKILPKYANQPEFIRRFEAEAKLVAQLDHLHIAPLYDYWRDPTGAYLVMRFLRGGTLRDSVRENGPWTPRNAVRLLNQIGAALTVAHRRNVVHRDIKPANILLDDDENAYLTDFGIAMEMAEESGSDSGSGPQSVTGSAGYISPEQINLQSITPRADIYSMALVIYETLTGHHPFPDAKSAIALFLKHVNEPLPDMENYPPGVNEVLRKAASKEPEDRYENMLEFATAFKRAIMDADVSINLGSDVDIEDFDTTSFDLNASSAVEEVVNPYKGLAAFQEGDADDFFGRDKLIQTLLDKMEEDHPFKRFLAVVGPSGSGKSSVVKAGLLPALRKGSLPNSENWFIVQMIPGTSPLTELEDALMRIAINPIPNLKNELRDNHDAFVNVVDSALPDDGSELVIVIDQFEETFTTGSDKEREDFLQSLYNAIVHPDSRLRVIITLRADFYDRPLGVQNISGLMQQRTEVVIPFTAEELEQTITGPARRVNVYFQKGLASQIVAEVSEQPGVLPMLQYALTELFARREGNFIKQDQYQEIGGVIGALAKQAEEMYQSLNPDEQEAARQLFLRLVTLGEGTEDTRRRALQSEIMSAYNNVDVMQGVIDKFSDRRLLTTGRDPITRTPTVEVAHEALIREWGTLKVWLDESREDVRLQRMLLSAAHEWQEANNDSSFLLRGGRLVTFEEWIDQSTIAVAELERTYLNASLKERERLEAEEEERARNEERLRQRNQNFLRAIVVGALIFAVVGIALAAFALNQSEVASQAAAEAQRQAVTATVAQGNALVEADNAQTQAALAAEAQADALDQAATATFAQGDAIIQANIAETQAAAAATARSDAIDQAATATFAQGDAILAGENAVIEKNNAQTQQALAETAQADAVEQADLAATSEAQAIDAQAEAVAQADIAATSEADALLAQGQAQIAAQRAQSLALASFASQFSESNTPLAIALALEANNMDNPPLQAQQVLISVAYEGPRKFFTGDYGGVRDIVSITLPEPEASTNTNPRIIEVDRTLNFRMFVAYDSGVIVEWNPETNDVVQTFSSGSAPITSIDAHASDDLSSQLLVSADQNGRVILWDLETGEMVREFEGHTSVVNTVDFNSNGQRFVTASDDGNAIVWNTQTGDAVNSISTSTNSAINSAIYSPNNTNLLILTDDAMRLIAANATSSTQFLEFGIGDDGLVRDGEATNRIRSAIFGGENGEFIVTTGSAGSSSPEIWETSTRRLVRSLSEHNGPVNSVAVSEDGQFVLSAADDFEIRLSSVASGDLIRSYFAHQNRVVVALFTDSDERVISGSSDGEIFLWDKLPISRTIASFVGHDAEVDTFAQLPNAPNLFLSTASNGELSLWDGVGEALDPLVSYRNTSSRAPQTVLAVDPQSTEDNIIVGLASVDAEIRQFNNNSTIESLEIDPLAEYDIVDPILLGAHFVNSLAFSPDGSRLVSGGGFFVRSARGEDQAIFQGEDTVYPMMHMWDAQTGDLLFQYDTRGYVVQEGFDAPVTSITFSPDGSEILSGLDDGRLIAWSSESGAQENLREFTGHSGSITAIQFFVTLDLRTLMLTSSEDRAIILWDYESGRLIRRFSGHRGAVNDVRFSPDGLQILSGGDDTRVILWDIDTANEIQRFSEHETPVTSVAFVNDGLVALSGSVTGRIYKREIDTGGGLQEFVETNRYVPVLSCEQRQQFNLACDVVETASASG